ncbi:DPP IV N-terminal domain-containing protein [Mesorhizobium sp.]|uniref:DPP IV N-terminal domain-containing protein n=1 Tax=Mesorhizobium sp. TaxID=1871066 RepID=UPI00345D6765
MIGSAPDAGGRRIPEVHSHRYALAGDTNVPTAGLVMIDRRTRTVRELQLPPLLLVYGAPVDGEMVWKDDGRYLFVGVESRDFRTLTVYRVDPRTGLLTRFWLIAATGRGGPSANLRPRYSRP